MVLCEASCQIATNAARLDVACGSNTVEERSRADDHEQAGSNATNCVVSLRWRSQASRDPAYHSATPTSHRAA